MAVIDYNSTVDPRFLPDTVAEQIAEFERQKREYDFQLNRLQRIRHSNQQVDSYLGHLEEIGAIRPQPHSSMVSGVVWGEGQSDITSMVPVT